VDILEIAFFVLYLFCKVIALCI